MGRSKHEPELWEIVMKIEDRDVLRGYLKEVEKEIKGIVGDDLMNFYYNNHNQEVYDKIDDLVGTRKLILDKMFVYSAEEIKRMEAVNELLYGLYKQMYRRTTNLYRTVIAHGKDEAFDDDYNVEGMLNVSVDYDINDGDYGTVLHLDTDADYGSDFAYMIYVIQSNRKYCHDLSYIDQCMVAHSDANTPDMSDEELDCDSSFLDDGVTWDECLHRPDLSHICFCHSFHALFTHLPYSLPDILRINSYAVESKIVCQRLTDQAGRRWKDIELH